MRFSVRFLVSRHNSAVAEPLFSKDLRLRTFHNSESFVARFRTQTGLGSKGSSNSFEPGGDHASNLVGSVLLHEVETSDDDAVLIREASRQSPDSARDEYTGLRVNKELWQRCCFQPCGIGGNPIVDISRVAR